MRCAPADQHRDLTLVDPLIGSRTELRQLSGTLLLEPIEAFQHQDDWRTSLAEFVMTVRTDYLRRPALVAEVGARCERSGTRAASTMALRRAAARAASSASDSFGMRRACTTEA